MNEPLSPAQARVAWEKFLEFFIRKRRVGSE